MISCSRCQALNRDNARFCSECAAPLVVQPTCSSCGAANPPGARFCNQCAAMLMASTAQSLCPGCNALNPADARFCSRCAASLFVTPATAPALQTGLLTSQTMLSERYLVVGRIGQGGMGAIYQATDTRIGGKLWAVKELSEAAITDRLERQQVRQAFRQEAEMLSRLSHPNLPRVIDYFEQQGKCYLVMDFIEGQTLDKVLAQAGGQLPESQVRGWSLQLCDVLSYLHGQSPPIIFRDLKPNNIMVDAQDWVKLIDFGIARLFKAGKAADTASFGTAGYAPPEQYGKGQTDARSDVYALGATLHHLLTGLDPAMNPFQFQPVHAVRPTVSARLSSAVMKALEQEATQRWQSATAMRQALETVQEQPAPCPARPPSAAPQPAHPHVQIGQLRRCPRCGRDLVDNDIFYCHDCGERILRIARSAVAMPSRLPKRVSVLLSNDKALREEPSEPRHEVCPRCGSDLARPDDPYCWNCGHRMRSR